MNKGLFLACAFAFGSLFFSGCFFDTSGDPTLTETDAGPPDSGFTDAGEEIGLGYVCTGDLDCAEYLADSCMQNPDEPDSPGYCTISDCVPEDCLGAFSCCDCASVEMVGDIFCATEEDAVLLTDFLGCTCQ